MAVSGFLAARMRGERKEPWKPTPNKAIPKLRHTRPRGECPATVRHKLQWRRRKVKRLEATKPGCVIFEHNKSNAYKQMCWWEVDSKSEICKATAYDTTRTLKAIYAHGILQLVNLHKYFRCTRSPRIWWSIRKLWIKSLKYLY